MKRGGGLRRVVLAIGTRPEAVKLGPVFQALEELGEIEPLPVLIGQHREQLAHGLSLFSMKPFASLDVMTDRQRMPETASAILRGIAPVLRRSEADYVVVQGDTLSTFSAAWAAFLEGIPVAHVEAGLRTRDLRQPFPEEANRMLTDSLADVALASTPTAAANLITEGRDPESIVVTGQTGVDAILHAAEVSRLPADLPPPPYVTVTLHRRENWGVLRDLAEALGRIARDNPTITFVYPVHLNPVVRESVGPPLEGISNFVVTEPLEYGEMAAVLSNSELIVTDSGGLQEEAAALGVPAVVMRNVTERPEGISSGILRLAGSDPGRVFDVVSELLADPDQRRRMAASENPYGDGKASHRVAQAIAWRLGLAARPVDWQPPL
jgi:UDP-N-acetylglucosamine 2-epimerase (non-hydrolysing)